MSYKALVLAAGKSTRIEKAAGGIPKPLLEIKGEPVLIHNLKLLAKHGVNEAWINLHFKLNAVRECVGDGSKWGVSVRYWHEKEILGTAGALKNLEREFSGGPHYVVYGDNYTDCDLTEMMHQHIEKKVAATIAVFDASKNPNSGIAGGKIKVNPEGFIEEFNEGGGSGGRVNAGVYVLEPSVLENISKGFSDFGKDVFPDLLKAKKKIYAYSLKGFCFAVDTPESYERTRALTR